MWVRILLLTLSIVVSVPSTQIEEVRFTNHDYLTSYILYWKLYLPETKVIDLSEYLK